MKKVVVAALLLQNNALLICQRNQSGTFPGKWEFPGGKLEAAETPEEALRRELHEELGIDAEIGGELWRLEHQYPGHYPIELLFFEVRRYRGNIQNFCFQRIYWARPEKLPDFDFLAADRALIEKLAAGEIAVGPCTSEDAEGIVPP